MSIKTVGVLAGTLCGISLCHGAAAPAKVSGSIAGMVSNPSGIPQMGATVILYNRFDQLLQRSLTTEKGLFGFDALSPGVYTIQVSLASYLPALKRNIVVQPGMQSLLNVNLATVFSSIQLVAVSPGDTSLMSDEWKWVLRSSSSTRPVLRLLPQFDPRSPPRHGSTSVFSSTRGMLKVSGGDQGSILSNEPDLGTAFALATSFLGENQLRFSGNFGYSSGSGLPTAAFRTSFKREMPGGEAPEVRVTMRQLSMPTLAGTSFAMSDSAPVLRTLSASLADQTRLTDQIRFEYGATLDSVTFLDRLNYVSPYGRLTYDRGEGEILQLSYASGAPPTDLLSQGPEGRMEFQQDLSGLAAFPRVSLRGSRVRVQRNQSWEIGYRRDFGSRAFSAAFYNEAVSNAAVMMAGSIGFQSSPDVLPDVFSESWILNVGQYHGTGYSAVLTQRITEHLDASVAFGSGGALTANGKLEADSPDELRGLIRANRRHTLTMRMAGLIPQSGTQFSTSYQWADVASLTPEHVYLTQSMYPSSLGFNIQVRQPIPYCNGLPGRLEATADLRNILQQGYVPLYAGVRRAYLMHTPRSLRGGLSFIF